MLNTSLSEYLLMLSKYINYKMAEKLSFKSLLQPILIHRLGILKELESMKKVLECNS